MPHVGVNCNAHGPERPRRDGPCESESARGETSKLPPREILAIIQIAPFINPERPVLVHTPFPVVTLRRPVALGLFLSALVLGLSCSGPSPETQTSPEESLDRVYHVQLDMADEKATANQALAKALAWWKDLSGRSMPSPLTGNDRFDDSPVAMVWKPPMYRIRLGPFASRSEAEKVLTAAQSTFPDAFVAPERLRPAN